MNISEFDYTLPEENIAQRPTANRDESRLMVVDRTAGSIYHKRFKDVPEYFDKNDLLVINNSKVYPAKVSIRRPDGKQFEGLVTKIGKENIRILVKNSKRLKVSNHIVIEGAEVAGEILTKNEDGSLSVRLAYNGDIVSLLNQYGNIPLPHYIKRRGLKEGDEDRDRYQTVYAKDTGSIAAPTAGFHFTEGILNTIKGNGSKIGEVTLHVGYATFKPIYENDIENHTMGREEFIIPSETAALINDTKKQHGRITAVGTTSTRTLESYAAAYSQNEKAGYSGDTNLFIYPPYKFKLVDRLLTNFHLPKTTLFILVCAFAGTELIHTAYKEAIDKGYRFYSFGDAMLIL